MKSSKTQKRYNKIKDFLMRPDFNGFTKEDLFIMSIIKKGWGHDIAALSNMAEAITNLAISDPKRIDEYSFLINEVVKRALHSKVSPYRKDINKVHDLGKYGYYLEHLNIILGANKRVTGNDNYKNLNKRISLHLINHFLIYDSLK